MFVLDDTFPSMSGTADDSRGRPPSDARSAIRQAIDARLAKPVAQAEEVGVPASSLRQYLPPPNSLFAFEVTARHLSFTKAATELRVTQAAVSRQIRLLEDHLGEPVFERVHRGIVLTPYGRALYDSVSSYLGNVAKTVAEIRCRASGNDVTISASNAVSAHWLMHSIQRFHATHPEFSVRLVSDDPPPEPAVGGDVDLVLRFGNGEWPGFVATRICDEEVFPVCSPGFLERTGPIEPQMLRTLPLIESSAYRSYFSLTWGPWLHHLGIEIPNPRRVTFSNYMIALEAARTGHGLALGWRRCVQGLLSRGELMRAIDLSLSVAGGYYIAEPQDAVPRPATDALRTWLMSPDNMERDA